MRAMLHDLNARLTVAFDGNPFRGDDPDLYRTWAAVDETTRSIAFLRNFHEVRCCQLAKYRHAAAEGIEYRGVRA